jgi:hypothetical protein
MLGIFQQSLGVGSDPLEVESRWNSEKSSLRKDQSLEEQKEAVAAFLRPATKIMLEALRRNPSRTGDPEARTNGVGDAEPAYKFELGKVRGQDCNIMGLCCEDDLVACVEASTLFTTTEYKSQI